MLTLTCCVFWM